MYKIVFTKLSVKDISENWEYTFENWSEKQADKYYKLVIGACSEIAKNPEKGKDYSIIYSDLLGHKIAKHIIFYRIIDKSTVEITRILHEEMDLKIRLKK